MTQTCRSFYLSCAHVTEATSLWENVWLMHAVHSYVMHDHPCFCHCALCLSGLAEERKKLSVPHKYLSLRTQKCIYTINRMHTCKQLSTINTIERM